MAKALDATVSLDARYTPVQVQEALSRLLPALTFQDVPLRVEWYTATDGKVLLAPFGYRQLGIRLTILRDDPDQLRLHLRSDSINVWRVPLMYRREVRQVWESMLDRLRLLT